MRNFSTCDYYNRCKLNGQMPSWNLWYTTKCKFQHFCKFCSRSPCFGLLHLVLLTDLECIVCLFSSLIKSLIKVKLYLMLLELTSRVEREVAGSTVILTFKYKWSVWITNLFASSKYPLERLTWRRPVLRKFISLLWRERGYSGNNCFWLHFIFDFSKWNWGCSFRHNCHNALLKRRCCIKSR